MLKIPFLDNEHNDLTRPAPKFYKQKRFWLLVVGAVGASIAGDYTAIIPVVSEIFNGLTA